MPHSQYFGSLNGEPSIDRPRRCRRGEALRIDTVVDLRDPSSRNTNLLPQVILDVPRERDVVRDERPVKTPRNAVSPIRAVEVADIPTVFAMHAHRHAGEPCRYARLERCEVARVDDVGAQRAERAIERRPQLRAMARTLVQRDNTARRRAAPVGGTP